MIFLKKHLVLIINILLILAIMGGVFYAMFKSWQIDNTPTETVATADEPTVATETPTTPPEIYTIGIIQQSDAADFTNVYQGFIAELAANGYINKNNINLDYVLEKDKSKCKAEIQRFIDSKYDLIFSIGPYATKLAASMTTEIPIVFGAVAEPEQENFVHSNEVPGGNVTGVSDYTPCFEQIDSVKQMFPDTKKIGAIYYATDTEAVTQALIGEKEAQTEHISIDYERYPVESSDEIADTLSEMLDSGVEVIYAPVDSFITKHLKQIVKFANENKIPIVCGNLTMLEKGCFSTCVINYPSIGGAAGDMALDILCDDLDPAKIPIAYIYECYLHINEKAMKELEIAIPDEVFESAIIE